MGSSSYHYHLDLLRTALPELNVAQRRRTNKIYRLPGYIVQLTDDMVINKKAQLTQREARDSLGI